MMHILSRTIQRRQVLRTLPPVGFLRSSMGPRMCTPPGQARISLEQHGASSLVVRVESAIGGLRYVSIASPTKSENSFRAPTVLCIYPTSRAIL